MCNEWKAVFLLVQTEGCCSKPRCRMCAPCQNPWHCRVLANHFSGCSWLIPILHGCALYWQSGELQVSKEGKHELHNVHVIEINNGGNRPGLKHRWCFAPPAAIPAHECLGMQQIGKEMDHFAKFGSSVLSGCTDICSLSSGKWLWPHSQIFWDKDNWSDKNICCILNFHPFHTYSAVSLSTW